MTDRNQPAHTENDVSLTDLSPQAAYQFLQDNPDSLLVDIRSSMEYLFVGHPVGATHIAWIDEPDWDINPDFVPQVQNMMTSRCKDAASGDAITNVKDNAKVVLICRSGQRTQEAAAVLIAAGFQHVLHVNEGFEGDRDDSNHRGTLGGWRFHGLPWEQC